jgi:hypothetical protein
MTVVDRVWPPRVVHVWCEAVPTAGANSLSLETSRPQIRIERSDPIVVDQRIGASPCAWTER